MSSDDWWNEEDPFGKMFKEMMKRFEEILKDFDRLEPGKPFVKGFSLTIGPDGKPIFREIGSKREMAIKPSQEEIKADVIDQGDKYLLVSDLPGVNKESIELKIEDGKLIVRAYNHKKYYEVFKLPENASKKILSYDYNNGVLTVEIKKRGGLGGILKLDR